MESTISEFDRVYYEKYDTSSIIIRNGSLISDKRLSKRGRYTSNKNSIR